MMKLMIRERGLVFWRIGRKPLPARFIGTALYPRNNKNPLVSLQLASDVVYDGVRRRWVLMLHLHRWQKLVKR